MNDDKFIHLHVHSEYSLLDGMSRIKSLVKKAKELNMDSLAITDHGVMYGAVEFYKQAVAVGIKPIIGCEVYEAYGSRFSTSSVYDRKRYHLVLLAKNEIGYKNLMKICSLGFTEGFYYKPRIDDELLEKYSEGLICLSACISGSIAQNILENNINKARERALYYKKIFKDDFYLEIQNHGLDEEKRVNHQLIEFSKELNIELVATNDIHYVEKSDAKYHDILLCIGTQKKIYEDRMKFPSDEFYFKTYDEMSKLFPEEAIKNTQVIADKCNVKLDFETKHLPEFELPDGVDKIKYFKNICNKGLLKRIPDAGEIELDRLNYEINVIEKMGYVDYFLIVADFINYAKQSEIPVGPGRGSSAGSLVAYSMDITDVNPIKYNLIFERFLNPERVSMPDIDVDFCYIRREEVIDYVVRKYGETRVAQIISFGTLAARAVIRDVGRVLDVKGSKVDQVVKKIPPMGKVSIKSVLENDAEFKKMYREDSDIGNMLDIAMHLEGLPRHTSIHAAGILISKTDVMDYVPLAKNKNAITTQFNMTELEELGLLKMDFLALRNLTVIDDTIKAVEKKTGEKINFEKIGYDDKAVFETFSVGHTMGVFQFESSGMISFIKDFKMEKFEDISAANALYRPGPMKQIPVYIENHKHPENIKYKHPLMKKALEETYGCMVFQEQVMQIVREIAGFSWGRSDLLRRAMSKKKMSVMLSEKKHFLDGAALNNVDEKTANEIFDLITEFANYAFPKGHSVAYGMIAYQTAYLKIHYSLEYMAALITSVSSSPNSVSKYIRECKRLGIKLIVPDVNYSEGDFTVAKGKICFGLNAVKNVGSNLITNIVEEREKHGKFKSFTDFCGRIEAINSSKRQMESLIKCGAFDSLGYKRSALTLVYENIIDSAVSSKRNSITGQLSIMDGGDAKQFNKSEEIPDIDEFPKEVLLEMEKEILGIYTSGHPLDKYAEIIEMNSNTNTVEINELIEIYANKGENEYIKSKSNVTIGGVILNKQKKITKKDKAMAFFTIEDFYGIINCIMFPRVYEIYSKFVENGELVLILGKLDLADETKPQIIVNSVKSLKVIDNRKLFIRFKNIEEYKEHKALLLKSISAAYGKSKVVIYCEKEKSKTVLGEGEKVNLNDVNLLVDLRDKFGLNNVKIK